MCTAPQAGMILAAVANLFIALDDAEARILNVPEDFQTIEAAFNVIREGDTILAQPGVYQVHLEIEDHSFTLASNYLMDLNPESVDSTIIESTGNSSALLSGLFDRGTLTIIGLTFQNCEGSAGGAIDIDGGHRIKLENVKFKGNHSNSYGGGIGIQNCDTVEIRDAQFRGNSSGGSGGAVTLKNIEIALLERVDCIDDSSSSAGGGIHIGNSTVTMNECVVSGNTSRYGGGIFVDIESTVEINHSKITNNRAIRDGGGIMHDDRGSIRMDQVLVANNSAHDRGGGIIGLGAEMILTRVTLIGNTARTAQSMRIDLGSEILLSNSLIRDEGESLLSCEEGGMQNTLRISYCNFSGGRESIVDNGNADVFWLDGNIDADPLFLDPENGDYSLTAGSPCIDAGAPDSPHDPDGTRADMGAFYFRQKDIEVYPPELAFGALPFGEVDSQLVIVANTGGTPLTFRITESQEGSSITIRQADGREIVVEPNSGNALWAFYRPAEGAVPNQTFTISSDDPDEPEITIEATEVLGVPSDILYSSLFTLHSAYPNPFNSMTTIRYSVGSQAAPTRLAVYGLDGRMVADLWAGQSASVNPLRLTESTNTADRRGAAEERVVVWNADGLPGGIYIVRLESGSESRTTKVVLLR